VQTSVRLARLLAIGRLLFAFFGPLATPAYAGPAGPGRMQRFGAVVRKEMNDWGRTLRSPRRVARLVTSTSVGFTIGLTTMHLFGSPGAAAFLSYVSSVTTDRIIDRSVANTRVYGALAPPPLKLDAVHTLVGASVAGLSAPLLLSALLPLAHQVTPTGDGAPGLIGLGAQALFAVPLVRGLGGMGASMLATGAQAAMAHVMKLRPKARLASATTVDERVLP